MARLISYSESDARQNTVYLRLKDSRGLRERGITIYNATAEELLSFLIQSLKTAGYEGSWRIEDPPLTTQLLSTLRSFDSVSLPKKPSCHKCQQPLKIGDRVTSVRTEGRPRHYHESCYESTLH